VAIKRDLTEAKQLEAQLLQSQKMEVVGRLAGGIAHDFNNLLTVINGTAELMASSLPEGHPLRPDLREIELAGSRAATLTRQLLAFSRKQVLTPEVLDLTTLLADLRSMLQRMIGEDITLTIVPARNGSWIRADKGQIEQVLMNLVVNSRDAMPHGGTVTITTGDDLDPGHVLIEVRDTGTGMDEATLARLFEPFFTTKEQGKGTGLGLATVYGIVRQSGGTIDVQSSPGAGSTFRIRLPRVAADAPAHPPRTPAGTSGNETILVVEDEDRVRQMTGRMLESSGYRVLTASSGAQAMRILEAHSQPVHAMLTDVVMPGMSGPELVQRAAGVRPDLRVVYMSGHTDNEALRVAVFSKTARFIGKPFAREDLARLIRDTLDAPQVVMKA
jgi:CheY-like chemotaxis protein/anti-sigma regulatory factor (Ser/Thr protein kinase)